VGVGRARRAGAERVARRSPFTLFVCSVIGMKSGRAPIGRSLGGASLGVPEVKVTAFRDGWLVRVCPRTDNGKMVLGARSEQAELRVGWVEAK
jgi:hypothetical protein